MSSAVEICNLPVKCCNVQFGKCEKRLNDFLVVLLIPEIVHADIKTNGYNL